jgi:hypothetical protein
VRSLALNGSLQKPRPTPLFALCDAMAVKGTSRLRAPFFDARTNQIKAVFDVEGQL